MTVLTGAKSVFYAHVPKTGGTYVEDLFVLNGYRRGFWCASRAKNGLRTSFQHFDRQLYESCIDFAAMDFCFITVRHPVDRLLSEYRNSGNGQDIAGWLRKLGNALDADPYFLDNHFRPQVDFYLPPMAVFRQEDRYDAAWARAFDASHGLGFEVFETERKLDTQAKARPLSPAEADAVAGFCRSRYQADFEVFGYAMDDARAFSGLGAAAAELGAPG
ncbi:sulfotransferase family 2 domain-containing protein [Mangrovicoccus sp. HB161399]|uniref:sulfotransferase family 2 domain-containing protein n=1 Tax=Mangrovicoccus sp. HB161399 TaxID=2720392 RepID=UPI00155293D3|nr:sulfotransferase family 2 domain-containing protein [Mangrovicoccus sp. HB161399]